MSERIRQCQVNAINMLPHNDEAIKLMKEMLITYIKKDKAFSNIVSNIQD